MRTCARHILNLVVVATLLLSLGQAMPARAQEDPEKLIPKIIAQMTPEAKVGQLFVVAFPGTNATIGSDIGDLISELSRRRRGAIYGQRQHCQLDRVTPTQTASLIASLQNLARTAANTPGAGGRATPFIPLFVALEQSGNGLPHTQLTGGMSPLPSPMALGATWKPEDAFNVGKVVGTELAAVGVNLLLGPSLDVLDTPRPADAGVNVFGGDPYWVGVMGQNYVRGLRAGSQGRVAAVLAHFPGQGGTTEAGDEVERSLEQLKGVELMPFLSTLQPVAGEPRALADALMTSHMRYRGFTGNIRQRTAPLSLDAQAMQALLALPEVKAWRDAGGVLVSGSLGAPLIRRYYDPQLLTFPAQRAALDALQAGNDVLVLSDFGATGTWAEQLANIKSTIKFFQDKYSTDLTFQARVDDALARILRLKVRLYPGFDPASVIVNPAAANLSSVGRSRAVTLQVAQDALTLLAPSPATSAEKPLPVPTPQDSILIFTDDRLYRECATCLARPLLITDTLQQTMVRLYPSRVDAARITSLTFSNLFAFLNPTTPAASGVDVGAALAAANWVVFAALDPDAAAPQSTVLKQLVAQRPGLLANKKVILFAFDAPHYLEPEVIARATAVYALYGRTDPFVEVAVRALFGDAKPLGNPPVDVDAIRYRLIVQSEPNPNQIIQLFIGDEPKEAGATPVPVEIKVGDTLKLRTGAITDRNGHPVPDGTQVTFSRTFSQSVELPPLVAPTRNGVATISFPLDRIGPLRVRASSEPAMTSFTLQLSVAEQPSQAGGHLTAHVYADAGADGDSHLDARSHTYADLHTAACPDPASSRKSYWVGLNDLLLALVGVIVMGGVGYWTQRTRRRSGEADMDATSRAVRWGLWSVLAGLIGYVLYGLRAPGSLWARTALGAWTALVVAMIFGVVPVLVGFRILDLSLLGENEIRIESKTHTETSQRVEQRRELCSGRLNRGHHAGFDHLWREQRDHQRQHEQHQARHHHHAIAREHGGPHGWLWRKRSAVGLWGRAEQFGLEGCDARRPVGGMQRQRVNDGLLHAR